MNKHFHDINAQLSSHATSYIEAVKEWDETTKKRKQAEGGENDTRVEIYKAAEDKAEKIAMEKAAALIGYCKKVPLGE